MTGLVAQRLLDLQLTLPPPPLPVANYAPFVTDGVYAVVGKVGKELDLAAGRRAARLCAINLLAALKNACEGDLDRVRRVVMLRGFVNAAEDFEDVPLVMNGASDLLVEVFGLEVGRHARTSIGCATLPGRVAVEIDALVSISTR
jgi:enamine deaminase RidA (YjgF/YER057c/UK114 family)